MILLYILVLLPGIVIGSFLNVCIYRIPEKKDIIFTPSHCMVCQKKLNVYDLIPLASWLGLRGKCRYCKAKIPVQYPLVELCNGICWLLLFIVHGFTIQTLLYSLFVSGLLVLSMIDSRTFWIPAGVNWFLFGVAVLHFFLCGSLQKEYLFGFFTVSIPLVILFYFSKGHAIGGGDVKLMASAGLLLGWQNCILAFFLGCIIGSVIHLIRMAAAKSGHVLAMGPYLSIGIYISMLWGSNLWQSYFQLFF